MPCVGDRSNCELARESKRSPENMLNGGAEIAAFWLRRSAVQSIANHQPAMSRLLMAANAGRVTESFAALEATG